MRQLHTNHNNYECECEFLLPIHDRLQPRLRTKYNTIQHRYAVLIPLEFLIIQIELKKVC